MNENNLSEGFISKLTDISFKEKPRACRNSRT